MKKKSALVFIVCFLTLNSFMRSEAQILSEGFDAPTFPPNGWTNTRVSGSANPGTWQRITTGTNPTATPHTGAGMAFYNSYIWSNGNASDLSSPVLDFSAGTYEVSFWMFRDTGQANKYDSLVVYVDTNTTSAGATFLGKINRSTALSPSQTSPGWYQYKFSIPTRFNGPRNHIIFKAISDFGNRMYLDDIVVSRVGPSAPTSITTDKDSICKGVSAKLYAGGIDGVVQWHQDSCGGTLLGTGDSILITPNQTTRFYCKNFNNNQYSNCISIEITVKNSHQIFTSDTICAGDKFQLADGTEADTTGIYTSRFSAANGCDSTITQNLFVQSLPVPVISRVGDSLQTQTYADYQWLFDSEQIIGAKSQSVEIIGEGDYSVIVTDIYGCIDTSSIYPVMITDLDDQMIFEHYFYPNPARDYIHFKKGPDELLSLRIYNSSGALQYFGTIDNWIFDTKPLPSGFYHLVIHYDNHIGTGRLLKE